MAHEITLPPILDLRAAKPLRDEILAQRGQDLALDGSSVQRLGGLCFQVLLSAMKTWQADGRSVSFDTASESLTVQWAALGGPLSVLGAKGETQ